MLSTRRKRYRWRLLYTLVAENALVGAAQAAPATVEKNIENLVKVRDDLVRRIEKTMLFLASLLIIIFLVETKIITNLKFLDIEFTDYRKVYFVFLGLAIGNVIALLYNTAMLKMFLVELLIERFIDFFYETKYQRIAGIMFRFFPFSYKEFFRETTQTLPMSIRAFGRSLHVFTIFAIPLAYMMIYLSVLLLGLNYVKNPDPQESLTVKTTSSYSDRFLSLVLQGPPPIKSSSTNEQISNERRELLFWTLIVMNVITLPIYLFTFLPIPTRRLQTEEYDGAVAARAYTIWEESGRPPGHDIEHWLQAEKEIRTQFGVINPHIENQPDDQNE